MRVVRKSALGINCLSQVTYEWYERRMEIMQDRTEVRSVRNVQETGKFVIVFEHERQYRKQSSVTLD